MKIAICVPHYGDVKARFFQSAANMVSRTMAADITYQGAKSTPKIHTFIKGSAVLDANRTVLVNDARKWGADYVLFCDTDMTFPSHALLSLLAADRPVVGCNYARRDGLAATAARERGDKRWERFSLGEGIEKVPFLGLGLCLINAQVFNVLPSPWFRTTLASDGEVSEGEDGYFFASCHKAGVPVFVHHDLSREVGHIGEREVKLEDLGEVDAGAVLTASGP